MPSSSISVDPTFMPFARGAPPPSTPGVRLNRLLTDRPFRGNCWMRRVVFDVGDLHALRGDGGSDIGDYDPVGNGADGHLGIHYHGLSYLQSETARPALEARALPHSERRGRAQAAEEVIPRRGTCVIAGDVGL